MPKAPDLKVGDKVAYSVQFLKSIGESHGEMARGRGEIMDIRDYGVKLARINWTTGKELPETVNVGNLALVGPNSRFCAC